MLLTDRPAHYRWFGNSITIDRLTPAIIRAWRGRHDDQFRPSLEALRQLAADATADVVLADSDTMARGDLTPLAERLAAGAVFMHHREYRSPRRRERRPSLAQRNRRPHLERDHAGPRPSAMWNAGVVGSSRRHTGIFDRTLAVFDEIRPVTRYFAVDQLACSIVFAAYAPIEPAAPWFDHYWGEPSSGSIDAIERFLSGRCSTGFPPTAAADQLKTQPITGDLDARAPWWLARLRRLLSRPYPDDDDVPEFDESADR